MRKVREIGTKRVPTCKIGRRCATFLAAVLILSGCSLNVTSPRKPGAVGTGGLPPRQEGSETGIYVEDTPAPETEGAPESEPEPETESEPESESEPARESEAESTPEIEPESETETDPEPIGDPITIIKQPKTVYRNTTATLTVKGTPGVEYTIRVLYTSGASKAQGLEPKTANALGRVSWSWKVGGSTTPGTYVIEVSGGGQTVSTTFTVKA